MEPRPSRPQLPNPPSAVLTPSIGGFGLKEPRLGQRSHSAIQRQRLQSGPGIVFGDQSGEQAGPAGGAKGLDYGPAVQGSNQTAGKGVKQSDPSIRAGHAVVVPHGNVSFSDNLIRREDLAVFFDQGAKLANTAVELVLQDPW